MGADVPDKHEKITLHWGTGPKRIFLKLLEESLRDKNVPEEERVTARHDGVKIYDELMYSDFDEMTCAIPGVAETLERLQAVGLELAINSASELRVLQDITFPKAGIRMDMFDEDLVWTSDRLLGGQEKPSPYPIHQILMSSGISKDRTMMVGDSISDVYCADQAGITPIVVLSGNVRSAEEASLFVAREQIIENINQIDGIICRQLGRASLTNSGVCCQGV